MERGPVQVVVVGFADEKFAGEVLPELRRLRGGTMIRLLDVVFVSKDEDGFLTAMDVHDVVDGEWSEFGETVGGLIGFGAREEGLLVGAGAGAADGGGWGSDAGEAWAISDVSRRVPTRRWR